MKSGGIQLAQLSDVQRAVPIGLFMSSFEPGGTEGQMIELARRLDPRRWAVHVATFHARGGWFSRVAEIAASVAEFPVTSFRSPSAAAQLRAFTRWCRERRLEVLHTTELYSNIFGLPGAALASVPVRIGNRREINPDKSAAQIAVQRVAYAAAHVVVANSRAAAERLRLERVPARKIAIIPNGLDVTRFSQRTLSSLPRRVVVVANLRPEKAHSVLIDATPAVLERFPDATFHIVGDGPERTALMARAHARGVLHSYSFVGHDDDVRSRLAASDLFVLPSRSEAFPNAVLEAMAAGLPIVASGVGGVLELIDNDRTGLLVPPGDPGALAERICRLMSVPGLASRLGAAARTEARASYSFDRMIAAFESLYLTELARRGVRVSTHPQLATS
jgi:glycosyltransferase involved in cell wall biosynthesis